jgi:hypothetical protein
MHSGTLKRVVSNWTSATILEFCGCECEIIVPEWTPTCQRAADARSLRNSRNAGEGPCHPGTSGDLEQSSRHGN